MGAGRADNRDFAIDTYRPNPNELWLAEARVRNYRGRHASLLTSGAPYLAVTAGVIFPSEIPQYLSVKLRDAETTASVLAYGGEDLAYHDFLLHGVVIFDARTGRLVSDQGYVVADTPHLGEIARFGSYFARFIGTGH
jgi:hypothetical protein